MAIPVIYKGDDTDFRGSTGFTLKVVTPSNLNLSGCTVEVEVLGYRKSFPASATGEVLGYRKSFPASATGELVCPLAFTAAETQRMPLGIHAATVRVFDSKGRVRTINDSIRVKVTNSVHEAYGKDDPQEVTLAVSTVDLEAYAKKADVTAAIEKAMKDASASVKLHAIAPEVTDTTVTLKPVDGAANYVTEKAEVNGLPKVKRDIRGTVCLDFGSPVNGDLGLVCYATFDTSSYGGVELQVYHEDGGGAGYASFTVSQSIPLKVDDVSVESEEWETEGYPVPSKGDVIGYIGPDTTIEMYLFEEDLQTVPSTIDVSEVALYEPVIDDPFYQIAFIDLCFFDGCKLIALAEGGSGRDVTVAIPSTTGNVRKFSLTVETDAEEEKDVTWSGCTVIEAFPGASKLVPGLNVWDVSEVAPGKFRVSRASSPAQSAPLTLTAPNGRVAELTVGDDLVLEVKEV